MIKRVRGEGGRAVARIKPVSNTVRIGIQFNKPVPRLTKDGEIRRRVMAEATRIKIEDKTVHAVI